MFLSQYANVTFKTDFVQNSNRKLSLERDMLGNSKYDELFNQ